ncbi:MAG: hypothetical protein ACRD3W_32190 [Terriglobales bacterium]
MRIMFLSIIACAAAFALLPGATPSVGAPAAEVKPHPPRYAPKTKDVVITGEVVDSWCFASQVMGPGRGERHKACALACVHGGVTPGIVDDQGNLYIAAKHHAYTGCQDLLLPYVAKRVKVTGWLAVKGGCNLLKIAKVELAK